ncbi:hypothetical protein Micbo1qcDRAFT_15951 [Microdochium bolleyi]|uniref:Uncharacterized protein n=1 Tax=Microdochium bolleyi TaxID=196109 RepID=A0A136IV56_9PEZI|nr:hypothetical protein Micbo1qcDRAFT_15951 [Microdochium bolleyi]
MDVYWTVDTTGHGVTRRIPSIFSFSFLLSVINSTTVVHFCICEIPLRAMVLGRRRDGKHVELEVEKGVFRSDIFAHT